MYYYDKTITKSLERSIEFCDQNIQYLNTGFNPSFLGLNRIDWQKEKEEFENTLKTIKSKETGNSLLKEKKHSS